MIYTVEQFLQSMEQPRTFGQSKCADCGIVLQETITGNRRVEHGHVCSDCYFKALGEELDEHPITALRVTRGVLGTM